MPRAGTDRWDDSQERWAEFRASIPIHAPSKRAFQFRFPICGMSAEPALVPEEQLAGSTGMPPPQETGVPASERQPDSSEPAQQLQPPLTPLSEASDEDGLALLPKHTVRGAAEDKLGTDEHDAGRRNLWCCCLSVAIANVMFIRPFRLLPGGSDNR